MTLLRKGSRGGEVTALQNALKAAGFNPGPVDGIFGRKTAAALKAFQRSKGLQVDGVYGPKSAAAMSAAHTAEDGKAAAPNKGADYSNITIEEDGDADIARFTRADHFNVGETGDAVREYNAFLKDAGYLTDADIAANGDGGEGVIGSGTLAATDRMRAKAGLPTGGQVIVADDLRYARKIIHDSGAASNAEKYTKSAGRQLLEDFGISTVKPGTVKPGTGQPGTEQVGTDNTTTTLPKDMRLVKVTNPSGSDASAIYHVVGTVYGTDLSFEVGDITRLKEMFGGVEAFDNVSTLTQVQYDSSDLIDVGSVDEIAGSTESLQAQYERDSRKLGMQHPPAWVVGDKKAMALMVTAANEGWTPEETWGKLSKLDSFKRRFPGLDTVQNQLGTTKLDDAVKEYTSREAQLRPLLLRWRGPHSDTSPDYVKQLVASGWQPQEVNELLELEQEVKGKADALDNINRILASQGIDMLTPDGFVDLLREERLSQNPDFKPSVMFEAVNDALRQTALQHAGVNVSDDVAKSLGTGTSTSIKSPWEFKDDAQKVAGLIAANSVELDIGAYGLSRDEVVKHFLGESDDPAVKQKLDRIAREKNIAGYAQQGPNAFVGKDGRMRVQGFSDLK